MAYIDPQKEEEENKNQPQSNSGLTSSETSIISSTGGGQQQSKGGGAKGWTNLQQYTKANQAQGGQLGEEVSKGVQENLSGLEEQQQQYKSAYDKSQSYFDKLATDRALAQARQGEFSGNEAGIKSLYNLQYQGPSSEKAVSGYGTIESAYNRLTPEGAGLGSTAGQKAALQSVYGKGGKEYTSGEQALDAFILGSTQPGRQAISDVQQNIKGSKNRWKQTLSDIAGDIVRNRQYIESAGGEGRNLVNTALGQSLGNIQQQQMALTLENQRKARELQALRDSLQAREYEALGLQQPTGQFLASEGFDFSSLYSPTGQRQLGDVIDPNQQKLYNALSAITSQQPQYQFETTGNAAEAFAVNQPRLGQAQEAAQLNQMVLDRLRAQQAERDRLLERARSAAILPPIASQAEIINNANILGISPEDYQKALDNNIDLRQFVQAGKQLNIGDVASQQEASQWDALRQSLGLSSGRSFQDVQDEGAAFTLGNLQDILNNLQPIQQYVVQPDQPIGTTEADMLRTDQAQITNTTQQAPLITGDEILGNQDVLAPTTTSDINNLLGTYLRNR